MDIARIKDLLSYDQITGKLTWLSNQGTARAGDLAGNLHKSGYINVSIDGKRQAAHRVIWAIQTGHVPTPQEEIDHKNHDRSDNRWSNLRLVTSSQNKHNSRKRANNTSGYLGVSWHAKRKKWVASIGVNGKVKNLGGYETPELAHQAYLNAKKIHHPTV